jgi:hypothetical protein
MGVPPYTGPAPRGIWRYGWGGGLRGARRGHSGGLLRGPPGGELAEGRVSFPSRW